MKRKHYIIALLTLFLSAPLCATAAEEMAIQEETTITMAVRGSSVHVCGAEGETLDIYNLAGVKVKSIHIDSEDKTFTLNLSKGCYVLKIGDVVRKMSIR